MNILYGLTQPDEGTILADGKPLTIHSPKDAIAAGIGMVHQHFMLVPVFTVAENVTLGDEQTRPLGLLDRRRMRQKVRDLSRAVRTAGRPRRADRGPARRRAAAGGDPQGTGPGRPGADPGRAHGRADPRRDRGPVPDHAGAAGKRTGHRLHLAQAQGGAGDRRHDHDPAPRPGGGRAPAEHQRGRAGRADGRPLRPAAGRPRRSPSPAGSCWTSATWSCPRGHEGLPGDRSTPSPSTGCPSGCGRARSSAWPACRATARPSCARR